MVKPSLPEKAETGVALIDALDTLHLQLDELVDSPSQYFRHICDAIRVLLDAPLVAFLYPVAIDPVTNYHMYRTYGFPLPESGTPKNPAERIPSDGAIFTFEPYATRFHRSQFVKGYGRLHVNESEDGNAESPDWWPRTFATSIDKNNEHDTSEGSSTERTIPAESPAKLDTGSNDASGEFTKMFSQFAKSGTAYVAHYISPSFVQIPPEHLEDSMQNDPPNLPPQLGFLFCIFFPKEALKKFPEEAQEGRLLEVDWVLRLVDSWLRTAFADVFSHLGTEDDNPLSSANSNSEKVQEVGKTMKRTASDALEEQEDPSKQDSNDDGDDDDAVMITTDDKSSSEVVTRANQQPTQKRARTHRASRHNHGTSTKHDHTHDSERHFSYMNRDNVFGKSSEPYSCLQRDIASFVNSSGNYLNCDRFSLMDLLGRNNDRNHYNHHNHHNMNMNRNGDDNNDNELQPIAFHLLGFSQLAYLSHTNLNCISMASEVLYGS
ncbi:hypothetical protein BDF22DRAFT_743028 [Syncephalis plumigaleata]|nr:hypothetical protein BDF22DRAFT_743028 [Syncephalis plumigaleata]